MYVVRIFKTCGIPSARSRLAIALVDIRTIKNRPFRAGELFTVLGPAVRSRFVIAYLAVGVGLCNTLYTHWYRTYLPSSAVRYFALLAGVKPTESKYLIRADIVVSLLSWASIFLVVSFVFLVMVLYSWLLIKGYYILIIIGHALFLNVEGDLFRYFRGIRIEEKSIGFIGLGVGVTPSRVGRIDP